MILLLLAGASPSGLTKASDVVAPGFGLLLGIGLLALVLAWLVFPFLVLDRFNRLISAQDRASRSMEAVEKQLETINHRLTQANTMHGDLDRAAQWLVDRGKQ